MEIAFLGLGRMGRELANHLITDGHGVTVWNRTDAATVDLVQRGAGSSSDAASAVAGAEVVVTAFFGPDAVREVVVDAELPIPPGAVWLDVTTAAPTDVDAFEVWAARRGVRYVHGPVIGTLAPARARKLSVLLGGEDPDAVSTAKHLSVWGDPDRIRTYPTAAQAAAAKLVANLTLGVAMEGLVEALRLGHANSLGTSAVLDVLDLTMLAPIKNLKGQMIETSGFTNTQFSAALLAKDLRLILGSTDDPLPAASTVLAALEDAIANGHGEDDFSVIAAGDAE